MLIIIIFVIMIDQFSPFPQSDTLASKTCMKSLNILFLSDSRVTSSKADSFKNLSLIWNCKMTVITKHQMTWQYNKNIKGMLMFITFTNNLAMIRTRTPSHVVSGSSGGVACFSMFLKAASFLFIFLASSFSRSLSLASAFSNNCTERCCKMG